MGAFERQLMSANVTGARAVAQKLMNGRRNGSTSISVLADSFSTPRDPIRVCTYMTEP